MPLTFTVIICAYTLDRWELLQRAVASAVAQTQPPAEIIVCADHNPELASRCRAAWTASELVRVIENHYPGRLGSARNSAAEIASGDVLAFIDDDAVAEPDWLERLVANYAESPSIQAVGGAPRPEFQTARPRWFPYEFDWVFGCAYRGLPTGRAATGRLIGASMSARRQAVLAVGGFHSDNHDDMDLSHRLLDRFGSESVVYDPEIQVRHYVSAERVTWNYFWRRCFNVNRGKVLAVRDMADAGNHEADMVFVKHVILRSMPGYLRSWSDGGPLRAGAVIAGVLLAALGNLSGRVGLLARVTEPSLTQGLSEQKPA